MKFNKMFGLRDFLSNERMSEVLPQFKNLSNLQNVYSFAVVEKMVKGFLKNLLQGEDVTDGLVVSGSHARVLKLINQNKGLIESFFNSTPRIAKNLRSNTKLYSPFATLSQVETQTDPKAKLAVLQMIMDNINYNPDFNSQNSIAVTSPLPYRIRQERWKKQVGYKEKA